MAVKKGLGKGLDALITAREEDMEREASGAVLVELQKIEPNRSQPRKTFGNEELLELAESIKTFGVISPLIVKKEDGYYSIIAGERRWRAARLAGLKAVPVVVAEYDGKETLEIALIENLQREDLNPVEEALAYKRLAEEFGMTQEAIAGRLGKSRSAVANAMRLLGLSEHALELLRDGAIQTGHGKVILGIENPAEQNRLAELAAEEGLSVRELEDIVKGLNNPQKAEKKSRPQPGAYAGIERELGQVFGVKTRVRADKGGNKGRIEIEFYSKEELDRIYLMLRNK